MYVCIYECWHSHSLPPELPQAQNNLCCQEMISWTFHETSFKWSTRSSIDSRKRSQETILFASNIFQICSFPPSVPFIPLPKWKIMDRFSSNIPPPWAEPIARQVGAPDLWPHSAGWYRWLGSYPDLWGTPRRGPAVAVKGETMAGYPFNGWFLLGNIPLK